MGAVWTKRTTKRTRKPSRDANAAFIALVVPEAQAGRVVVVDLKAGTRVVERVLRVADPLDKIVMEQRQRQAAMVYRQAWRHGAAGIGFGPLPWGRDAPSSMSSGEALLPQERALSSNDRLRRCQEALGEFRVVVDCVVLRELPLAAVAEGMQRGHRWARAQLDAGLDAMATEFGY